MQYVQLGRKYNAMTSIASVLTVMAVVVIGVLSVLSLSVINSGSISHEFEGSAALDNAHSCVEMALSRVKSSGGNYASVTGTMGCGQCNSSPVVDKGNGVYTFKSTGTCQNSTRTVEVEYLYSPREIIVNYIREVVPD